ncbi:iron-containing alcohol dehydrogenase [Sulfuricurvum sp.]|uniref:iron-containing alcohol dehydrogenase n=1 Tax=Sulfuricurvum sp. TaxID=2025608 RepID=UPI00260C480E|nr:iron-containing alcohol dehydrogenase [Sulfuricurvum sp.]MDD4950770.1 iron-containing alcohol dehydrogenase [Sulfuricurvum sp.]
MTPFSYHNPTRIEFGPGKENNIGQWLKEDGIEHILLVYGEGSIKKNGLYERVVDSLKLSNIKFDELSDIISNPVLSKVYEGIAMAQSANVQAILAVGGGSVIDTAKAIAAGTLYDGDIWECYEGKSEITSALPLYTIVTLAAAASEMNGNSVITNEATQQKYSIGSKLLNPRLSIVNPELMQSVSKEYLVYSASDIIAHALETYLTATDHPHFQSRLVESIIKSVIELTDRLIEHPEDYHARAEFAWVSSQALNGLTTSGTGGGNWPNHMIEHALSALFNIPHGAGLSIVVPAWMSWYKQKNKAHFERFAKEVFGKESAEEGITMLKRWYSSIGTPITLSQANIPKERISDIAKNAHSLAVVWGMGELYSVEDIIAILEGA